MNRSQERTAQNFRDQAEFLRALAVVVKSYNENLKAKIDMHWLMEELEDAAKECEQEAEAV